MSQHCSLTCRNCRWRIKLWYSWAQFSNSLSMFKLLLFVWFKEISPQNETFVHYLQTLIFFLLQNTKEYIFLSIQLLFVTLFSSLEMEIWNGRSNSAHCFMGYSVPQGLRCLYIGNFAKFKRLSREMLQENLHSVHSMHTVCVWDIQNLHSPFIQSICNFTCLCIYANDCLDMVDLEIIPKCPAF